MRALLRWSWLLVATLLAGGAAADPARPSPFPPAHRSALIAIDEDPAPRKLLDNFHFVVSNEKKLELFHEPLRGLGGIIAGVGTDQNYVFAGWARPEVLVLLDFDRVVVDLHLAYQAFFLDAPDPAAFLDRWSPGRRREALALLDQRLDPGDAARVKSVLTLAGPQVHTRLREVRDHFAKVGVPSFLTDAAEYAFVVELVRAGRVRALRGDLTGKKAMRGLALFARSSGLPVRMIYTSNAEEHFGYTQGTRDNFLGLPGDDRSLVVRTLFDGGKDFFYVVQPLGEFQRWLGRREVTSIRNIVHKPRLVGQKGVIRVGGPPSS